MGRRLRAAGAVLGLLALALVGAGACAVDRALNRVTEGGAAAAPEPARAAHARLVVVDLHADPLLWSRDLARRAGHGHVDLPRLREGNVALQVFGVATKSPWGQNFERNESDTADMMTSLVVLQRRPRRTWGSLLERARDQAARLEALAAASNGGFRVIRTKGDLERLLADRASDPSLVGGVLGTEGLHALEGRLESVDALFDAGFRMMGLAHFFDNEVAGSAHGAEKGGLTPLGEQVIARMEALGIALDLAHASPRAVDDALARATKPVVVSHTGVQGTCPGPRNLSDDQLRRIAATGGAIGIGFFPGAVCGDDAAAIARAFAYARGVVGASALAFGSDWDGATTTPFDA
ncbi:MAG TPA: membrane dipeptidase, partial [Myxococcota bacterium]|nr:membrane dipeptidase [Myxococcota bacterium]